MYTISGSIKIQTVIPNSPSSSRLRVEVTAFIADHLPLNNNGRFERGGIYVSVGDVAVFGAEATYGDNGKFNSETQSINYSDYRDVYNLGERTLWYIKNGSSDELSIAYLEENAQAKTTCYISARDTAVDWTMMNVLSAPTNLNVVEVGSTSAQISWSEVTNASDYKVEIRQGGGGWTEYA